MPDHCIHAVEQLVSIMTGLALQRSAAAGKFNDARPSKLFFRGSLGETLEPGFGPIENGLKMWELFRKGTIMKASATINGEVFDHKLAAIFDNETSARKAAEVVGGTLDSKAAKVFLVGPNDAHQGWELEPEDRGIWRTMLKAHLWLGVVGAAMGLLLFFLRALPCTNGS